MKPLYIPFFFLFITFSCLGQQNGLLSVKDFQEKMLEEEIESIIIDLRTTEEMEKGYIPGAIQLDFHDPDFNKNLNALAKDKSYFIYCKSGGRSGRTFDLMEKQGFQQVYNLDGGIKAWKAAGMKTEKPD